MKEGKISAFQTMGTHDGPGIRFVIFMQGCNLRCVYCHNPESWPTDGGIACSVDEVFAEIQKCVPYFGKKGGVTVSGGEPLLQPEFVYELFSRCKNAGIHTCLDTSGSILTDSVKKMLSVCGLVLLDIKMTDNERYKKHIGVTLDRVLEFLAYLDTEQIPTWIRHVVVPGINDSKADIARLKKICAPFGCIKKIELKPFLKLCLEKYYELNIPFPLENTPQMTKEKLEELKTQLI